MVLSHKVEVVINPNNYDYWSSRGYTIPSYVDKKGRLKKYKRGTSIEVLVSELPPQSNVKIEVICNVCGLKRFIHNYNSCELCWKCNLNRQKGMLHPRFQAEHKYLDGQDRIDDMRLKRMYGIDLDIYNSMLESQNYKCLICFKNQFEEPRKFTVDHCHTTGKVRGLLCNSCNRALGIFSDSVDVLQSAINYLNRSFNG